MIDRNTEIRVLGRGGQFYSIPELKILRQFGYYEVKHIPLYELQALIGTPGGEDMIRNCLIVEKKGLDALGIEVEKEYFYDDKIIKDILFSGDLDRVEDTLNFGNEAVKDMMCRIAVREKVYDNRVLDLIQKYTGCDIKQANVVASLSAEVAEPEKKKTRKVALKEEPKKKKTATKAGAKTRKAPQPKIEDLKEPKEEN